MAAKKSLDEWKQSFQKFDKDNSGFLDICELRNLMRDNDSKITDYQIIETFVFIDGSKGDKKISMEEFLSGMKKMAEKVEMLKTFFKAIDKDQNGHLDRDELTKLLKQAYPKMPQSDCDLIFKSADTSGDGKITLDEFLSACT